MNGTTPIRLAPGQLEAAAWTALSKVAAEQADRDQLTGGCSHAVDLSVAGHVDGQPFERRFSGVLSVGPDQQRATSSTPELPKVLATILGKLNPATREKILRELPEQFAAMEGQLDVPEELVHSAERLLQQLRSKKTITARGSVRCHYHFRSRPKAAALVA